MSEVHLREDFKNPWFLMVLGLIATALGGTVWMAIIAGANSPGLVSEDYYEKGKNYFHKAPETKDVSKWRLNLLTPAQPKVGQAQTYRFYAIDDAGRPLTSGTAILYAYRPSDARADFKVEMKLSDSGTFSAVTAFPLPGIWDLIAQVKSEGKQADIAQRLFVQQ